MKKTAVLFVLLAMCLRVIVPLSALAAESRSSDYTYTVADGSVTITGYTGEGGAIVIPSEIDGLPVTSIGYRAFCEYEILTSVTLPDSLAAIESEAFYCCYPLEEITFPDGLETIGSWAFYRCNVLQDVYIPKSVVSIGWNAFDGCDSVKNIYCEVESEPERWYQDEWFDGAPLTWYGNCRAKIH